MPTSKITMENAKNIVKHLVDRANGLGAIGGLELVSEQDWAAEASSLFYYFSAEMPTGKEIVTLGHLGLMMKKHTNSDVLGIHGDFLYKEANEAILQMESDNPLEILLKEFSFPPVKEEPIEIFLLRSINGSL